MEEEIKKEIQKYREHINRIDDALCTLLAERFEIVREIMKIKQEKSIDVKDKKREQEIIRRLSEKHFVRRSLIQNIYQHIFHESIDFYSKDKKRL
jgi:chorismate mutase